MAQKFCPRCNSNERVVLRKGKRCCACCGFDADYMSPPISNDYAFTRPRSQDKPFTKPDVHDDSDRTFQRYDTQETPQAKAPEREPERNHPENVSGRDDVRWTFETQDAESPVDREEPVRPSGTGTAAGVPRNETVRPEPVEIHMTPEDITYYAKRSRMLAMFLIAISLGIAYLALFVMSAKWALDDGTFAHGTIYQRFCMLGFEKIVVGFCMATLFVAFFCPKFLILMYAIIGLSSVIVTGSEIGGYIVGIISFFMSFVISGEISDWKDRFYPNGCGVLFFLAFWMNMRVRGYSVEVPESELK